MDKYPKNMKTRVSREKGMLRFDFPCAGLSVRDFFMLLLSVFIIVSMIAQFFNFEFTPEGYPQKYMSSRWRVFHDHSGPAGDIKLMVAASFAFFVFGILCIAPIAWNGLRKTRVFAGKDGIRVEKRLLFFRSVTFFSPSDVSNIITNAYVKKFWNFDFLTEQTSKEAIEVYGPEKSEAFGAGLETDELEYCIELMKNAVLQADAQTLKGVTPANK